MLERKLIYSTNEVKLAMKLLLGQRANAEQVRRTFFTSHEDDESAKFVPVNAATLDWAYHVMDRMAFEPSWHINFR